MRCDFTLLSLFLDQELSWTTPLLQHLQLCSTCRLWLKDIAAAEQQIYDYEKERQNFILVEIFDVPHQRRQANELGWEGLWLGVGPDGSFDSQPAHAQHSLHLYLQAFWFGQTGIYVENLDFPLNIVLHRGHRYLPLPAFHSKRLIATDGLIIQDGGVLLHKLTLQLPANFKENSITRKYKSLALVSGSFIARFFQKKYVEAEVCHQWKLAKQSLTAKELGIYLMHLKDQTSYKKIAAAFRISPHQVGDLVLSIRQKILPG